MLFDLNRVVQTTRQCRNVSGDGESTYNLSGVVDGKADVYIGAEASRKGTLKLFLWIEELRSRLILLNTSLKLQTVDIARPCVSKQE
jgi:hypothetical protein